MKIKVIEKFKTMEKEERRRYVGELLINNSLYSSKHLMHRFT